MSTSTVGFMSHLRCAAVGRRSLLLSGGRAVPPACPASGGRWSVPARGRSWRGPGCLAGLQRCGAVFRRRSRLASPEALVTTQAFMNHHPAALRTVTTERQFGHQFHDTFMECLRWLLHQPLAIGIFDDVVAFGDVLFVAHCALLESGT